MVELSSESISFFFGKEASEFTSLDESEEDKSADIRDCVCLNDADEDVSPDIREDGWFSEMNAFCSGWCRMGAGRSS